MKWYFFQIAYEHYSNNKRDGCVTIIDKKHYKKLFAALFDNNDQIQPKLQFTLPEWQNQTNKQKMLFFTLKYEIFTHENKNNIVNLYTNCNQCHKKHEYKHFKKDHQSTAKKGNIHHFKY